jgi:hypothetical protein
MTTTPVVAHQLVLEVDGTALECAVASASLTFAQPAAGGSTPVACGDDVPALPDPGADAGELVTDVFMDWSDTGWSYVLASKGGQVVDFTLSLDTDKPDQATSYTGTLRVPYLGREGWTPKQYQRQSVTWPLVTVNTTPTRYTAPPGP